MKKAMILAVLLSCFTCLACKAEVSASLSVSSGGTSFYLSIGDYYSVPQQEVIVVRDRHIPDEEIPVVFYLARQANVAPSIIIDLRLKGKSWMEITNIYGFGAEIYYVPVSADVKVGPPYGHAYGYYRNRPKKEWNKISLEDDDIVNLVNLKFITEHYNYPSASVMKMRENNQRFYTISDDLEKHKGENKKNEKAAPYKNSKNDKGAPPQDGKKQKGDKKQKGGGKKQKGGKK